MKKNHTFKASAWQGLMLPVGAITTAAAAASLLSLSHWHAHALVVDVGITVLAHPVQQLLHRHQASCDS